jgi:hyperosmotically inducible protein
MGRRIALLVVIAILGVAGYFVYQNGFRAPRFGDLFSSGSDVATIRNVKDALGLSSTVSGFDINVNARDGVVTLTGQVPSDGIKTLANEIAANASGVKRVDNLIAVDPAAKRSAASSQVADLDLKSQMLQAISRSPDLGTKKIEVNVVNQVISLTGAVDTTAQRSEVEQIAHGLQGVVALNDNLSVTNPGTASSPSSSPSSSPVSTSGDPNADLAKRVEFELFKTEAFDLKTVKIAAENGVVTLSGDVRSRAEQLLADRIAGSVDGVKKVDDRLKIPPATSH